MYLQILKCQSLEKLSVEQDIPQIKSIFLATSDEGSELARINVVVKSEKISFVELERHRKLLGQLPNAVDKLSEDRRNFFRVYRSYKTAALGEFVPERQPLFLNQYLKT